MKQSPELEALSAADEAGVSSKNAKRNQKAAMAVFLLAGVAMVYFVLRPSDKPENLLSGDEQFNTTSFRPPSFTRAKVEQPVAPEPEVINLPPPPPQEQPAAPQVIDEFPKRFRSKLIEIDRSQANSSDSEEANGGPSVAGSDSNSKFLAAASTMETRSAKATKIKRIDAVVPEGTLIPGILETSIVSDLPGQIRAITSEDVYSFDGRRVLIPAGTRLIGEYQSDVITGQTRIFVVWTRLLRDDGVSVRLNSLGSDSLGRSGLTGDVDKKWRERFGASIMLSIVGAGASYLMGYGSDNSSGTFGLNNGGPQQAEALARQTIAQTFSQMANTALSDSLRIKPTISVHQGERIFIFVRQDLDFSAMYDDPVTEAIKDIRRERLGK
ncbi:type IV secretion system protein VirB10 [Brucella intermedia]|uniref:type IV secretion system protein VirB10 n=1 Tax=Brucella intermedia TaxID=94625 RepID=UPI000C28B623|nr:type IV secretion system protein VirB10 [Brucella intermedia]PJR91033.1 conjugal transfer protein TrbI [Ochrobactrum sp. 721/2009]PJT15492.1 conjugal transfer protein TrbI [Ochrobactrum sp. 720/2009]PJT19613.1 conjugal transfer protein TrbI [Ochrobactrum sp. 715/2009]PJT30199.1 conjugal transfer protein TrbI [Ochrobactrum sp. 695/2009]PJT32280.1 conjugal transfer protein TrbI [Ochrobactrum sp. 689/2009]